MPVRYSLTLSPMVVPTATRGNSSLDKKLI